MKNLWAWRRIIWRDQDWDSSYLLEVMEFKLRRMGDCFEKYGHHVDSAEIAKQVRLCAELCKRLHEDNYMELAGYRSREEFGALPDQEQSRIARASVELQKQDLELLGNTIEKYLLRWWD